MMNRHTVGLNVKQFRHEAGITQKELSEKAGLSQNHIAQIECGRRAPSLAALTRIAQHLDVDVSKLLDGEAIAKELYKLVEVVGIRELRSQIETMEREDKKGI